MEIVHSSDRNDSQEDRQLNYAGLIERLLFSILDMIKIIIKYYSYYLFDLYISYR